MKKWPRETKRNLKLTVRDVNLSQIKEDGHFSAMAVITQMKTNWAALLDDKMHLAQCLVSAVHVAYVAGVKAKPLDSMGEARTG